jgi:type I restriction enzyme S subunit
VVSGVAEQQVPKEYQQTEVGVIPECWEVKNIGSVLSIRHGRDQKQVQCVDGAYPILGTGGEMGRTDVFLYDKPSVLIGRKGTINKPAYMESPFWTVDTLFYSEVDKKYLPKFIFYKFCMIDWLAYNEASGVPSLNASTIEKVLLSLPETKEEQTAIANALSDVDALITSLEKIIAKKCAIKTAAMQQLLTGKKRLPPFDQTHTGYKQTALGEFPEDWAIGVLGAAATFIGSGNTNTKGVGGFPLYGSTGQIGTCNEPEYEGDSILVARVGANAGRLYFVNGLYGVSDNTIIVKLDRASYIEFYKYQLIKMNLNTLVFGSGQPLITGSQLKAILLPVPTLEEQVLIAGVLSDMDRDIERVNERLNKTKYLKHGMMQELLTGRTRLV